MKEPDTHIRFSHGVKAVNVRRDAVYRPAVSPGFAAWATAFEYGDGRIGVSFKETLREQDTGFNPPVLAAAEIFGLPVSYCSIECGSADQKSYRVYMASGDGGVTFTETGRCPIEEGSFCNIGFPDGRILGLHAHNLPKSSQNFGIAVRESMDGGTTWHVVKKLLSGCAVYLWRARRLRDGTIVALASLYGTPWGEGEKRATRNTMLPGETYLNKIQTFFLTSVDGHNFTGPHYVLPGIGAHEYDFVEKSDGSLLFIAGDVQATPVGRQIVERQDGVFINGPLLPIFRGAPPQPMQNPQGGFVPESMVALPDGLIVGSRRGKPYACSNDDGANWYEIDDLPVSLYQPYMLAIGDGGVANFGHLGGDNAFGEIDMYIGADFFRVDNQLPAASSLSLKRCLSDDRIQYLNRFESSLQAGGKPLAGQTLIFRFTPVWRPDGTVNTAPQDDAPIRRTAVTDTNGIATVDIPEFDKIPDIHHYYNVDVVFEPTQSDECVVSSAAEQNAISASSAFSSARSPLMCVASLRPRRNCLFPYDAHFANGRLCLSPNVIARFPGAAASLMAATTDTGILDTTAIDGELIQLLLDAHVLIDSNGTFTWYPSIHHNKLLDSVEVMLTGDWYV